MAGDQDSAQERTESPTPRRRDDARREGRIARTADASGAVIVLAGGALLGGIGGAALAQFATRALIESARALTWEPASTGSASAFLGHLTGGFALAFLPFAGGITCATVGVGLAQTRGALSLKPITPDLSRLNPLAGLKRLVSPEVAVQLGSAAIKTIAIGLATWSVLSQHANDLLALSDLEPRALVIVLRDLLVRLALSAGLAHAVIACADYAFQHFRLEKSLRMTRQEIVQESRDTDGDPQVKGRLRQLARARARQRMLQQVPTADVVVVNPVHIAVALRYDPTVSPAPIVVAMGERKLAESIKDLARKSGVPIIENRPIARALKAAASVGKPIPPALYTAIAEILAFVYRQRLLAGRPLPGFGRSAS